nr:hypothetical protein Iba_chr04fCG2100 [Ipomoea batatas]
MIQIPSIAIPHGILNNLGSGNCGLVSLKRFTNKIQKYGQNASEQQQPLYGTNYSHMFETMRCSYVQEQQTTSRNVRSKRLMEQGWGPKSIHPDYYQQNMQENYRNILKFSLQWHLCCNGVVFGGALGVPILIGGAAVAIVSVIAVLAGSNRSPLEKQEIRSVTSVSSNIRSCLMALVIAIA